VYLEERIYLFVLNFLIKRLFLGILTLFAVILFTFIAVRVVPSDPAAQWVGGRATPQELAAAREELGLDKPIYVQFKRYIKDLSKGNLGYSVMTHQPVVKELKSRFPATLELVFFSTFCALLIGFPLGMLSAKAKNSWIDHFIRFFTIGAVSIPSFWLALFLQLLFFMILKTLPYGGSLSAKIVLFQDVPHVTGFIFLDTLITGNFVIFKDFLKHLILPVICIGAFIIGSVTRITRSALLEILGEDYIRAARSYGLSERFILFSYALKNSLGPTISVVTLDVGYALMSTFLVETIFSWPGIGKYMADAVVCMDYPAIIGITMLSAFAYIILNLIADIIISLDPRVKL